VIIQAEVHDRLVVPTVALMAHRSGWEKSPNLQSAYLPMLKRIQFLAENNLTSMMVLFDFLLKCITPLQQRGQHESCSKCLNLPPVKFLDFSEVPIYLFRFSFYFALNGN
jgi:hypothetical protein